MIYRLKNIVPVAVKIVQPGKTSAVSIQDKQQFQKEVLVLSSMKHENIVRVKMKIINHLMFQTKINNLVFYNINVTIMSNKYFGVFNINCTVCWSLHRATIDDSYRTRKRWYSSEVHVELSPESSWSQGVTKLCFGHFSSHGVFALKRHHSPWPKSK